MRQPFEMRLEVGKIREFARATGSTHPAYYEEESPVTPATFLMASSFWQGPEASPFSGDRDMSRILQGGQEFVFPDGPPEAGMVLTGQVRLGDPVVKQGRRGGSLTIQEIITEFRDEDGKLVAESISTSIRTSRPTGAG